ncbi:MAG: hypothetical protein FJX77_04555 [Armatimonadetes bacterium]|nr:hypothetical protein [Armatimonadota bacterium]
MIRYPRPPEPDGLREEARPFEEAASTAIRAWAEAQSRAAAEGGPVEEERASRIAALRPRWGKKRDAGELPELWQKHREPLFRAQGAKCGFCESQAENHPSAVEHFYPKGEVHLLEEPGPERRRRGRQVHPIGYYWMAYRWENWLIACERCNTGYKRNYLPVGEGEPPLPDPAAPVTPLLLHPFASGADEDPEDHLRFTPAGAAEPRGGSRRGQATIDTCGLNHRPYLAGWRAAAAVRADRAVERLLRAELEPDPAAARRAAEELLALGEPSELFAGVVRSRIRDQLPCTWRELKENLDDLYPG